MQAIRFLCIINFLGHIKLKEVKLLKRLVCILLILILMLGSVFAFYEETIVDEELGLEDIKEVTTQSGVPSINARSAILYDLSYGRILYEKNPKQRRANASTTKMLTAIVAYENGNLEDVVTVSKKAATTGGSTIKLRTGDKITLGDLIKGLLVHSGNDAAVAIAEHIAGSEEEFAKLLNEKAEKIGAVDTNFITPHGLDSENHYSTAFDLVLIGKCLLEIPFLSNIVSQKSVEIKINGNSRILGTTNEMLGTYIGANGIKTGFTGDAGRCLVTSVTKDDRRLICVVLGCDTKKDRTLDSIKLLDYGFKEYTIVDLSEYFRKTICINVDKSEGKIYTLTKEIELKYPLKDSEISEIKVNYKIKNDLEAPIKKGTSVGISEIYVGSSKIAEFEYLLPMDIPRKTWKSYFKTILECQIENINNNKKYSEKNVDYCAFLVYDKEVKYYG